MLRPGGPGGPEFFSGVFRSEEEMVFVVNLDALLDVRVQSLPVRHVPEDDEPLEPSEEDAET